MELTDPVKRILSNYESDNPGTKANLARILLQGRLGGTGKLLILPVDQGVEHGPARSFAPNPPAYDPHYHYQLALEAGLSAYAAPLGFIEAGAGSYAGQIPLILKANSANSMSRLKEGATQAVTASVFDVFCSRLCVARTCDTSLVPMPNARAPNAPCVEVCESPQTIVLPGCVSPSSGPMTWTMPSRPLPVACSGTPNSAQLRASASSWSCDRGSAGVSSPVATLWSIVATVRSGRRTLRPARRRPSKACGEVTSWTR